MPFVFNPFTNNFDFYEAPDPSTVLGPGSSTDRAIATWNGVTGTLLFDNPTVKISSSGQITAPGAGASSELFGLGSVASAVGSHAFGNAATASGTNSLAIGLSSTASNTSAISIGNSSTASGISSVVIGKSSSATTDSVVIGTSLTEAFGTSVLIGSSLTSNGIRTINIGASTTSAADSVSIGNSGYSDGGGVAIGGNTVAYSVGVAIGYAATNTSTAGVSVGYSADSAGSAVAVGFNAGVTATEGIAVGANASSAGGICVGASTIAGTSGSVVVGYGSTADNYSTCVGGVAASSTFGTSLGFQAISNGGSCVAIGYSAYAANSKAIAIGYGSYASNKDTIAIGHSAGCGTSGSLAIGTANDLNQNTSGTCLGYANDLTSCQGLFLCSSQTLTSKTSTAIIGGGDSSFDTMYLGEGYEVKTPQSLLTITTTVSNTGNTAGTGVKYAGGRSTGNAAGGTVTLATSPAGAAGSTLNALVDRLTTTSAGVTTINPGYTSGAHTDIRGVSSNSLVYCNATNNVVGIFTASPTTTDTPRLHVNGLSVSTSGIKFQTAAATGTQTSVILSSYIYSTEQTLGTLTWTGTTPPTVGNSRYRFVRVGTRVTVNVRIDTTVAGTAITMVDFSLPADCPTPSSFTGCGNSELNVIGAGAMSTAEGTPPAAGTAMLGKDAGGLWRIYISSASIDVGAVWGSITYFV